MRIIFVYACFFQIHQSSSESTSATTFCWPEKAKSLRANFRFHCDEQAKDEGDVSFCLCKLLLKLSTNILEARAQKDTIPLRVRVFPFEHLQKQRAYGRMSAKGFTRVFDLHLPHIPALRRWDHRSFIASGNVIEKLKCKPQDMHPCTQQW